VFVDRVRLGFGFSGFGCELQDPIAERKKSGISGFGYIRVGFSGLSEILEQKIQNITSGFGVRRIDRDKIMMKYEKIELRRL